MKFARVVSLSFFALGSALPCSASDIAWESRIEVREAFVGDSDLVIAYRFKNTSNQTMVFTHLAPNCPCVSAEMNKQKFAPNENGEVKIVYKIGNRAGTFHQRIDVFLINMDVPEATLEIAVTLKEKILVSPRILSWRIGEDRVEKTIDFVDNTKRGIKSIGEIAAVPGFEVVAKIADDNTTVRLFIRPSNTQQVAAAIFPVAFEIMGAPASSATATAFTYIR